MDILTENVNRLLQSVNEESPDWETSPMIENFDHKKAAMDLMRSLIYLSKKSRAMGFNNLSGMLNILYHAITTKNDVELTQLLYKYHEIKFNPKRHAVPGGYSGSLA